MMTVYGRNMQCAVKNKKERRCDGYSETLENKHKEEAIFCRTASSGKNQMPTYFHYSLSI
jgi:hypothetical protein